MKPLTKRILPLTAILLIIGSGTFAIGQISSSYSAMAVPQASTASGVYFDHVVIVIMEDHGMQDICGDSPPPCLSTAGAPYLAGLANTYTIGSQYLGVTHYSQADYLALLGATTDNCSTAGCPYPFAGPNLVDRLESAGLTWKGYMENQNLASGCDMTYHQPYTPEHNPFAGFSDITSSPTRCSNIVLANPSGCSATDCSLINDLNSVTAPNFMWLTPNNCDNMHGVTGLCAASVSFGDSYLSGLVPNILNSLTFKTTRAALFVVFDEGNGYCPLNQSTTEDCVYNVWAGPVAKQNFATSNLYNHYSWTKTIEVNWNLPSLTSNDASATPMSEYFASTQPPPSVLTTSFTYSPTSPQTSQSVTFTASASGGTTPYSDSWNFGDGSTGTGATANHAYTAAGTYTVTLTTTDSGTPQQTATSQKTITVISTTPSLTSSFTYSPSNPSVLQSVQFTGSATGGTAPYSYSWNFGDGNTGTGSTASNSYLLPGTYTVVLTVTDATGVTTTASQTITVSLLGL
ncbi:MAG TPA: PKD domain-containing protein [Candidatus Dormibacteraeota bacterium]|nr:PKD domain-containing protein [Candidatus Dormibacteraeota bacterium]